MGGFDLTAWNDLHVPGTLLFKVRSGTSVDVVNRILDNHNVSDHQTASQLSSLGISAFKLTGESAYLARDLSPLVEWAEPDCIGQAGTITPNDPGFPGNAGIGGITQWYLQSMQFDSAWSLTEGSGTLTIADINTGLDPSHPDFDYTSRVIAGWNVVANSSDTHDVSATGHGTKCTGIYGAATNNATGITGADWNCQVMPIQASFNSANQFFLSDFVAGVNKAVALGANIIDMPATFSGVQASLDTALNAAFRAGCILIGIAGDNSAISTIQYPAGNANTLPLFATKSGNAAASYNEGYNYITASQPFNPAAPGGDVGGGVDAFLTTTTVALGTYSSASVGTSFSGPLAAACASVAWANNRKASNAQILAVLRDPNNADATTGFANTTKQLNALKCAQASFALSRPVIWFQ